MYGDEEAVRPYARALVSAAMARGELGRVRAEMDELAAEWAGCEEFRAWAAEFHSWPRAQHREVVEGVWGEVFGGPVRELLVALSEHGMMRALPLVVAVFRRLADAAEGRWDVEAEFAVAPTEAVLAGLRARVEAAFGSASRLRVKVRPALGAGVVFRAGDRQWDGSLAGRLRRLSRAFGR